MRLISLLARDGPDEAPRRGAGTLRSARRNEASRPKQVGKRRGEHEVGDAVGAGDSGVELQRDAQQAVAGERVGAAGARGGECRLGLHAGASVRRCRRGGCQRLVSESITSRRKRAHRTRRRGALARASARGAHRASAVRGGLVGREERLDRELGDGHLGRRAERRDRADEAQDARRRCAACSGSAISDPGRVARRLAARVAAQLLVQRRERGIAGDATAWRPRRSSRCARHSREVDDPRRARRPG